MIHIPSNKRYNQWAGNERGIAEDPDLCIAVVTERLGLGLSYQCKRKRGFGPSGEFCYQHSMMAKTEGVVHD